VLLALMLQRGPNLRPDPTKAFGAVIGKALRNCA
jgi:hypothetical protein